MTIFACLAITVALAAAWLPMAHAQQWSAYANISETMGTNANRLCMAEASRGDIGCPTYAPYVNATSGNVGIGTTSPENKLTVAGGNIRMDNNYGLFFGTSGWYGISNNTATNTFNIGANNARITLAAVPGNIGINTTQPSTTFHVSGTLRLASGGEACDTDRAGAIRYSGNQFQVCYGSGGWVGLADISKTTVSSDRIASGTMQVVANNNGNSVSFTENGSTTGYYYGGNFVVSGVSTTGTISATNLYVSNSIGIGTATPAARLDIKGTNANKSSLKLSGYIDVDGLSVSGTYPYGGTRAAATINPNLTAGGANTMGAMHVAPLLGNTTSGFTWGLRISPVSSINASITPKYFGLYLDGSTASAATTTYALYATRQAGMNYLGGNTGINAPIPSQTLHISGTFLTTSWTGINFSSAANVTPTAPLEVYGTVSATVLQLADNPSAVCGPTTYGTVKVVNGRQYTCRP